MTATIHGHSDGSATVTVACPAMWSRDDGCGADVEVTRLASGEFQTPPACHDCCTDFTDPDARARIVAIAQAVFTNYDPTP